MADELFNLKQGAQLDPRLMAMGGVAQKGLFYAVETVAFGNTTAKTLFTLPAGAKVARWIPRVITAFNGDGTDLLLVGTATDDDAYIDDMDVSTTGEKTAGILEAGLDTVLSATAPVVIKGKMVYGGSAAAAGLVKIGCFYYF